MNSYVLVYFLYLYLVNGWNCKLIGEPQSNTYLKRQNWLSDIDPLAVCNDGSPGAYYFSPAGDEGKGN